ncbi:MAG TPA: hypothetical protein VFD73_09090, partial [Gemmatimonadales bacterium]|nr:hypothetical protein [Gemmatimonadales bacterium]
RGSVSFSLPAGTAAMLVVSATAREVIALWYGRTDRRVEIATGTAVWYHAGLPPVPIPSS